jgi:hypothetical protein
VGDPVCILEQTVMIKVVQRQRDGPCQRLAWDPGITGLGISLTDGGEWIFAGESHFDFPLSFSIGGSTSLVGDSLRSCSTSLWQQQVQSVEAVLGLVWSWRTDSFQVEAVCYLQETHGVDMLQDYTSQGIAVHILIWDPGIGVLGSSVFDGVEFRVEWLLGELTEVLWPLIILLIRSIWVSCVVSTWRGHILRGAYFVSHRWIWDPGIICRLIQLLLEDKQYSSREDCNVPIFGHYYITECYAYQSSQTGVTASSRDIEGFYWARLASFIIFHHQDPFRTAWLWFRCIPTISVILSYYGPYFN